LGISAVLEGRNDLTINGLKFSGNAKTVAFGKTLQHGTILFSSKIGDLSSALKVKPFKFADKAVKSVRARVTNVSEHLPQPLTLQDFVALVRAKVHYLYPEIKDYFLSPADQAAIRELVTDKYETWEWNYGKSPRYNLHYELRSKAGIIEFFLQVNKGIILEARIFGDFFSSRDISELEQGLAGLVHKRKVIADTLQKLDFKSFFGEVELEEILGAMF